MLINTLYIKYCFLWVFDGDTREFNDGSRILYGGKNCERTRLKHFRGPKGLIMVAHDYWNITRDDGVHPPGRHYQIGSENKYFSRAPCLASV